jgi:hypothetical protein
MDENTEQEILDEDSSSDTITAEDDASVVEEDGELYLRVDAEEEGSEEPEEEPEESGESQEGKSAEPEESVDATTVKEPEAYREKSRDELIGMHQDATKKIGKQGTEIGELRESAKVENLTDEEVYEKLSSSDVAHGLEVEKVKLMELETYEEGYDKQRNLVASLEKDFIAKKTEEEIQKRFAAADNQQFIEKQKERFKEQKVELTDDEFTKVTENAKVYVEDGRLTERAYHKSLIDQFGVNMVVKNFSMEGEKKARNDISKADKKKSTTLNVQGSGKGSRLIRIADMGRRELRDKLDNLSTDELSELYKRVNK